jgi:hypothetical protein
MNINNITMFAYLLVFFGLNQVAAFGQSEQYFKNWQDPEVKERIKTGIEQNRMGWVTLKFIDEEGKPAEI